MSVTNFMAIHPTDKTFYWRKSHQSNYDTLPGNRIECLRKIFVPIRFQLVRLFLKMSENADLLMTINEKSGDHQSQDESIL